MNTKIRIRQGNKIVGYRYFYVSERSFKRFAPSCWGALNSMANGVTWNFGKWAATRVGVAK